LGTIVVVVRVRAPFVRLVFSQLCMFASIFSLALA